MKRQIITKKRVGDYWDCNIQYTVDDIKGKEQHVMLTDSDMLEYDIEVELSKLFYAKEQNRLETLMHKIREYGHVKYCEGIDSGYEDGYNMNNEV